MTNRVLLTLVATLASASLVQAGDPPPGGTVVYPREGQEAWRGDCDGDLDADIIDALLAARTAAGLIDVGTPVSRGGTCPGTEAACERILRGCDTDDNGRIDVVDSLQIAQMDVGIIPQGIEATIINVVPHSPDPSGASLGITDPHPINSAVPPNPFIGAVCLHYYLTAPAGAPGTADVTVEYSTQGGAAGTWLPATLAFGAGTTMPGSPHGTLANVVMGVPTDSTVPATFKSIVWDSTADIDLATQRSASSPNVVVRLLPQDDVDAPTIPGNDARTQPFPLGNEPPECEISTPSPGTVVSADVAIEYRLWDDDLVTTPWPSPPYPATDYTTATILPEYSTDGGLTWQVASEGPGSSGTTGLAMGPSQLMAVTHTFVWASITDLPGLNIPIDFRISSSHAVDVFTGPVTATPDVATGNTCTVPLQLVNNTPPACTIVAPVSMELIGDVYLIDFTILDAASDPLDITWEYSTNAGTTWTLITVTGGGTLNSNPAIAVPATPMPTAHTINWDSAADIMGAANPVLLRVTLDDRGPGVNPQCQVDVQVDNTPSCANMLPTTSPQGGVIPIRWDTIDADAGPLDLTLRYSTDGGTTFSECTVVNTVLPPVFDVNPALSVLPGLGQGMDWDSEADGLTDNPGTIVELEVTDGVTVVTCSVTFDVLNNVPPMCANLAASPASPTGEILLTFDTSDINPGDMHIVTVEYSTNFGVTYNLCTPAAGSPITPNPSGFIPPGAGLQFLWDANVDVPGAATVTIRIELEDLGGLTAVPPCSLVLFVDNRPECRVPPAMVNPNPVSGDYTFTMDIRDLSSDLVTLTWEYSIDSGFTFLPMTPAPPSVNPTPGVATTDVFAPFMFDWRSGADIPGIMLDVILRMSIDDGTTVVSCEIQRDVDNSPKCSIVSPAPGSLVGGDTPIVFDVTSPSGNMVIADFEFSINGGLTFNPATDAGTGTLTGNPTAPFAAAAGLDWTWQSWADVPGSATGVVLRITVSDAVSGISSVCEVVVDVDNIPTCMVTAPAPGSLLAGDTTMGFTTTSPSGNPVDLTFEFSTDSGVTFNLATEGAVPGTVTGNPSLGNPAGAADWTWDTDGDIPGTAASVIFRVTTADGATAVSSTCSVAIDVDNTPTCVITGTMPASPVSGDTSVLFDTVSPSGNMVTVAFDYSLNSGVTFAPATDAGTGTVTGNPSAPIAAAAGLDWTWMTASDIPGAATSVILQMTVTDDVTGEQTTCRIVVDVDNGPSCQIIAPGVGSLLSADATITFDAVSPSGNMLAADFAYSINSGATFNPATDAGTGGLVGNPTAPFAAAAGLTWDWSTASDIPASAASVIFQVTVTDTVTMASSTCTVVVDVDNQPTCNINLPAPGSLEGGDVTLDLTTTAPAGGAATFAGLALDLAFSIDGGGSFVAMTDSGSGSLLGNPAPQAVAGADTWGWNSLVDLPGSVSNVIVQVTVTDVAFGGSSTCRRTFDVDNRPSCVINAPAGGLQSGVVTIDFDSTTLAADSPSFADLTATVEYSTNAGLTFLAATDAATGSVMGNPTAPYVPGNQTWDWDSALDIAGARTALVRVTVQDVFGGTTRACTTVFDVDNGPSCTITGTMPGSPVSGDTSVLFDTISLSGNMLVLDFAFSLDGGLTFSAATEGVPGTVTGNPTAPIAAALGQDWTWDTSADVPGGGMAVVFEITATDALTGAFSTCRIVLDVANVPSCVITPFMGAQSGNVSVQIDGTDPLMVGVTALFEYSTDSGVTYNLATEGAPPGTITGSPTGAFQGVQDWTWDTQADGIGDLASVIIRATVDNGVAQGQCTQSLDVLNAPACTINLPMAGSPESGVVAIDFTGNDPSMDMLTATLAYSVDGGVTFQTPTEAAPGSVTGNPTGPFASGAAQTWNWDSAIDLPAGAMGVIFQLTVDDGSGNTGTCQVVFDVISGPSCVITPFMGPQSGEVSVAIDVTDPLLVGATVFFEFSTDSGVTYNTATEGATPGSITGSPTAPTTGPQTWSWDTQADGIGDQASVIVRATVDNGASAAQCSASLNVLNVPSCAINAPMAGSAQSGVVTIDFTGTDPSMDMMTAALAYSVDGGVTFLAATEGAPPGSVTGNPTGAFASGAAQTWSWDSALDVPAGAAGVIFRITVDDGFANTATCQVVFDIISSPSCVITPFMGPQSGMVTVAIDVTDPLSPPGAGATVLFEYSTDFGVTYQAATEGAPPGTITGSPTGPTTGAQTWTWDTQADGIGDMASVILRATVDNGAAVSSCQASVDITNAPTCVVNAPVGGLQSGVVPIDFTGTDPSMDMLTATVAYSTDFGATFLVPTDAGTGSVSGSPTAPFASGAAQTWDWDSAADIPGTAVSVTFRVTVDDGSGNTSTCETVFDVDNNTDPTCVINAPMAAAVVGGAVTLDFDATDPDAGAALDITFQYTTDGGLTYLPMSTAGGSPLPNPGAGVAPAAGLLFRWDSAADMPATGGLPPVADLRITVDDGFGNPSTCVVNNVAIDNEPSCVINAPMGTTETGDVTIDFDVLSLSGNPLNGSFEYSTDAGGTFQAATPATGLNPRTLVAGAGQIYTWDSLADFTANIFGVIFRVTVEDGAVASSCTTTFDVMNDVAPTCMITLPMPGATVGGIVPVVFDTATPTANMLTATFEFSVDSGVTFQPATDAGGGTLTGNPTAPFAAGVGLDWNWDTATDVPAGATSVIFRITVTDSVLGVSSSCVVVVDIDNSPTCANVMAAPSPAAGDTLMSFDTTSPSGNMQTATFEFSVDGGLTWSLATDSGGGALLGNPTVPFVAGAGQSWTWMTASDIPGDAFGVIFRVTVTDAVTTQASTCQLVLDVLNAPSCTIIAPMVLPVSGDVLMAFTTVNPTGNTVDLAFDYSLNGGLSFTAAVEGTVPGTVTGNPALGVAAGAGDWSWSTAAAVPGALSSVVFRLTTTDSVTGQSSTCTMLVDIDNRPTCANVMAAPSPAAGDTLMSFDTTSPSGNMQTATLEFSVDGGVTYTPATDSGAGALTGNPTAPFAGGAGQSWTWMTASDIPGDVPGAIFRVTVTDAVTGETTTCQLVLDVLNAPSCTIIAPMVLPVSGDLLMAFTTVNPTGNPLDLAFDYSLNGGLSFTAAVEGTVPGTVTGNPALGVAAGAGDWSWSTAAAVPGALASVVFRLTTTDSVTGQSSTCTMLVDIDNRPTCANVMAAPSPAFADTLMSFDTTSPSGNMQTATLEFSVDGGVTYAPATDSGGGALMGNPTAPFVGGAGQSWTWMTASDIPGAVPGAIFRVTVADAVTGETTTCQLVLDVLNAPSCVITPLVGAQSGEVTVGIDVTDPLSPPGAGATVLFEYSTNFGVSFFAATEGVTPGTITGNPTGATTGAQTWSWDTQADGIGDLASVIVRATVDNGISTAQCQESLDVANAPSCAINAPAGGTLVASVVTIGFTGTDPSMDMMTATLEFSTNGGLTYLPPTDAGTGGLMGSPTAAFASGAAQTWDWNTVADVPGMATAVAFRVTVDDGFGNASSCQVVVDVDNRPTCTITNPAAGTVLDADELVSFTTTSPTGNTLDLTFEFSTDAGLSFAVATEGAVPGTVTGNPALGTAAGARTWRWNTDADLPGVFSSVLFRLTTVDSVTGAQSTCERVFDADNQPTCNITLVVGGSPVAGNTQFQFTPTNPGGNMVTAAFEYSTDSGVTFLAATDSGGGALMGNPTAPFTPMVNRTWSWDSGVDVPGAAASTIFRITITDATSVASSTCQVVVDVANDPTCNVTLPAAGSLVANDTLFQFIPTSPTGNQLSALFEYTTNGGLTYSTATEGAPPGNLTGNPTGPFVAVANRTWRWASQVDVPADANGVGFRITLTDVGPDGMAGTADDGGTGTCELVIDVDNRPSCTQVLAFPDPPIADTLMEFDPTSASGNLLFASFEFSMDGGLTFSAATEGAPAGNLTGNPTAAFAAVVNRTWRWDTGADLPAMPLLNVVFRITVTDAGPDGIAGTGDDAASSSCQIVVDVDNTPSCTTTSATPDPAAGDTLMEFATMSPSGNMLFASFSFSTNSGASFAPATDSGGGGLVGNPTAPFMAGAMNTWTWETTTDIPGDLASAIWRVTVTDAGPDGMAGTGDDGASSTCDLVVDVDNAPECAIAPFVGVQSGNVDVAITGIDPLAPPGGTALFEFSTDFGVTFTPATEGAPAGTITGNPTGAFFGAQLWTWDTQASGIGDAASVVIRATYDNGIAQSTCQASLTIANVPTCVISAPGAGSAVSGSVSIDFVGTDPSAENLLADFDYSTNGGVTWQTATDAGSGTLLGNPAGPFASGAALTWDWDSLADIPGVETAVLFRITVTDPSGNSSTCQVNVDVDNNTDPSCGAAPTIMGGATGGEVIVDFTTVDPDIGAMLSVLVQYSTDGIIWNPITVGTCGGTMTSNPDSGLASGATSVCWDTGADIPDSALATVSLRVTLDDGISGPVTTGCVTAGLTIDNTPACAYVAPAAGALLSGTSAITYDLADPDGDLLLVNFLFSTDGGVSFNAARAATGSNPRFALPAAGLMFDWDTAYDIPGSAVGVILRLTAYDGTTETTCDRVFDVTNNTAPACVINLPLPGAMLMGLTTVDFDVADAEADPLNVIFEYSVNGGVTFFPMTPHFTSLLPNPAAGVAPAAGLTFIWNTPVDLPGGPFMVNIQIRVDDGQLSGSCDPGATVTVDNRPMPTCTIASPGAGAMVTMDQNVAFSASTPSGNLLSAVFEYDAGGGFMPATDAGTGTLTGSPTAPFPGGAVDWTWDTLADLPTIVPGVTFRVTLTDVGADGLLGTGDDGGTAACSVMVDVDNGPSCTINAPMPAAMVAGVVVIDFDASTVTGNLIEATYEYDAGGGFMPATDALTGGLTGNPTAPFAGAAGLTWDWDSGADIPALAAGVTFRISVLDVGADGLAGTVDDGGTSVCTVSVDVDNTPMCAINLPVAPGPVGGDVLIDFDTTSLTGNMLAATFEYDTGGGAMPATDSGGGALLGSPTAPFAAGPGLTWTWNSDVDIPTFAPGTVLIVNVTDVGLDGLLGTGDDGGTGSCTVVVDVENRPSCTIASPMAGSTVSGIVPLMFSAAIPSGNMVTATFEYDAGGGFMPATDAGGGTLVGNPTAAFGIGGTDWNWLSTADVPMGSFGVVLRVTLTDTGTGQSSACTVAVDVDQAPTCVITAPAMGAMISGNVFVTFDTTSATGNLQQVSFEYDVGGGFMPATDAGGGTVTGNPSAAIAAGVGLMWEWNTLADIPGMAAGVAFRITVLDVGLDGLAGTGDDGPMATCAVMALGVNNAPTCAITSPAPASLIGGPTTIMFDSTSGSGNLLAATFEFDAGGGFMPATDSGGGALLGNPTPPFVAGVGATWTWDTFLDIPASALGVVFRVTVVDVGGDGILGTGDDGSASPCTVVVDVNNLPTCVIVGPPPSPPGPPIPFGAPVLITFDAFSLSGNALFANFEFDHLGAFAVATEAAPPGTVTGNFPSAPFAAVPGHTWNWAAGPVDVPAPGTPGMFRITIFDAGPDGLPGTGDDGGSTTCMAALGF